MNLELHHIGAYLAHDIKIYNEEDSNFPISIIFGLSYGSSELPISEILKGGYKLMLRPLSDIIQKINHDGIFNPMEELKGTDWKRLMNDNDSSIKKLYDVSQGKTSVIHLPVYIYDYLVSWHFDVFGLIEKGLAVKIRYIDKI